MSKQVSKLLGVLVAVLVFGQAVGQQMEDEVAAGRAMMRAGWDDQLRNAPDIAWMFSIYSAASFPESCSGEK